jgi:peptidyl-prolyl cis-trans isomerase A (cyclophilin A)
MTPAIRSMTCSHAAPRASTIALALLIAACPRKDVEPRFEKEPASVAVSATPEPVPPRTPAAAQPSSLVDAGGSVREQNVEAGGLARAQDVEAGVAAREPQLEAPSQPAIVRQPTSPDPLAGKFTLAEATAGLPNKGALAATIETGFGALQCKLYDDKAPNTVANFIGLARGLRPFWDAKLATWVKRPLFAGTTFHRVIPDFMIQGGDYLGDGSGEVGYVIPDEVKTGLVHDRAGLLCMANRGPDTNGGQFFITDAATPHLTQMGTYTIFGECKPLDLIARIARAPRSNPHGERPDQPVPIKRVAISRK